MLNGLVIYISQSQVSTGYFGFCFCFMLPDVVLMAAQLFALANRVPFCSAQWERLYNTSRIPGQERGKMCLFWQPAVAH